MIHCRECIHWKEGNCEAFFGDYELIEVEAYFEDAYAAKPEGKITVNIRTKPEFGCELGEKASCYPVTLNRNGWLGFVFEDGHIRQTEDPNSFCWKDYCPKCRSKKTP